MASTVHVTGRMAHIPAAAAAVTAAAVPLAGWTVHSVIWHRRFAAARRDPLTGLLRRDDFTTRADRLVRAYGNDVLVLLADVDDFKTVNDTHGHDSGDQLLAAVADRLTQWAGSRGVVGRFGGDEFAVAAYIGSGRRQVRVDQLDTMLTAPLPLEGTHLTPAVSVGAAAPDLVGTRDLSGLLRAADAAMYAGKHGGRTVLAGPAHRDVPTVNGRRAGRPGTHTTGQVAA
ncbi:GGDEF domain-containing protein [Actinacidiphila yeochonensis]|uniref:GGDEF domain-containing protein n=1 Tax=Actinacidiphila yeochonensis TaxID=89050 RepID=UPI0005658F92|nr:GGDEF domain-containing protein [Actinacidiphila yeochonensis]